MINDYKAINMILYENISLHGIVFIIKKILEHIRTHLQNIAVICMMDSFFSAFLSDY